MSLPNHNAMDFKGMELRCAEVTASSKVTIGSTEIVEADLTAINALPASINNESLTLDIVDGSAEGVYYLVCPHAGTISKIYTAIDGAVGTADITVTAAIGATPVTNGIVTIATAGSAAGDVDVATPTAANTVTAGQAVNFTVTGGGAGGTPRVHLVAVITRT